MYQPQNIPQIFSDIVSNVADEMGYPIQFLHGTWQSIRARIVEQGTGTIIKDNRFPLICLVQVFEEKFKADSEYSDVSLTLLICTDSDKNWFSEDRYTNNYLPTLYPIYTELLNQIMQSRFFVGYYNVAPEHTKADDLHLPENNDNKLPECLDGLWVKDLKLKVDDRCLPIYSVVDTILEFGTPSQVGTDLNLPFNVNFSDIDGLKNGSTINFSMVTDNSLPVSVELTDNSSLYCEKVGNSIRITDISQFTNVLDLVGIIDNPLDYSIETNGKVSSMSGMKNSWINVTNENDIVIYNP